jgi:hypothetical protein
MTVVVDAENSVILDRATARSRIHWRQPGPDAVTEMLGPTELAVTSKLAIAAADGDESGSSRFAQG